MTATPKRLPAGVERRREGYRDPGGVHRTTPNTRAGRRMTGAKGAVMVGAFSELTEEQRQWNEQIEAKRKRA